MTQIYNDPSLFKAEMVDGFVAAYGRYVEKVPNASGVMRRGGPRRGKVSLIIGGGSGHYPAFCGTVGAGLADGAVIGEIFTSPSTEQAYRVGKALDGGAGLLFSFGNYAGDVMNFGAAQERLNAEGIETRTVLVTDDVASAPSDEAGKRRGIAGDFCVFKVAGAAADRGDSLDDVERLAQLSNSSTRTFGAAFAGCTFPGAAEPLFTVDVGRMELGLGIHGEPGVRSVERLPARELAKTLVQPLLDERPAGSGDRAAVILNGLGATKYEELFVLWSGLVPLLERAGVEVVLPEIGELVTSLDMAGCSLTLMWLDEELEALWSAPADTPAFRRGDVSVLPAFELGRDAPTTAPKVSGVADDASPASLRAARTARSGITRMLDTVIEHEQELGRIDAVAGDGDHGVGMVRGLRAANEAAQGARGGVDSVLMDAGTAWADKAGGTSGMLWGALLQTVGRSLSGAGDLKAERLAEAIESAGQALQQLGKANLGDKTMLDALFPFAQALRSGLADGVAFPAAWAEASRVATEAARATADLLPKIGRARPLGERSLGTPDPGATSLALCVEAMAEIIRQDCPKGEPE